jgi:hypothetical protein
LKLIQADNSRIALCIAVKMLTWTCANSRRASHMTKLKSSAVLDLSSWS